MLIKDMFMSNKNSRRSLIKKNSPRRHQSCVSLVSNQKKTLRKIHKESHKLDGSHPKETYKDLSMFDKFFKSTNDKLVIA